MSRQKELLEELSRCVLEMEEEKVVQIAQTYIQENFDPLEGILEGLVDGMQKASQLFDEEEYFIPEMLLCSGAMYNGLDILKPMLDGHSFGHAQKIVIGVVEGDTHDIGKNLVKIMLETAGYNIIDLGRDVPVEEFISVAKKEQADMVAMSTLMSTSMNNMQKVIDRLIDEGLRDQVKVIVGGGPISPSFAKKIGADGYSATASEAVVLVNQLLSVNV